MDRLGGDERRRRVADYERRLQDLLAEGMERGQAMRLAAFEAGLTSGDIAPPIDVPERPGIPEGAVGQHRPGGAPR